MQMHDMLSLLQIYYYGLSVKKIVKEICHFDATMTTFWWLTFQAARSSLKRTWNVTPQ